LDFKAFALTNEVWRDATVLRGGVAVEEKGDV
jgi:hypothetical protein